MRRPTLGMTQFRFHYGAAGWCWAAGVAGVSCLPGNAGPQVVTPAMLPAALKAARPGDTLLLADGAYRDQRLVFRAEGAEGKPITLRAAHAGKVVFSGASSLEIRGAWLVAEGFVFEGCTSTPVAFRGAQYCRLTECAIVRCNPPDAKRTHWIRVGGPASRGNRIDHCFTEGKLTDGVVVTIEGEDDGTIATDTRLDHNHFKNVVRAVRNGMETIRVGDSGHSQLEARTVVEANLFENCDGDAEIISSKSCGNLYRFNTFRGCDGGLVMRHGHRCRVEGNFFFGEDGPRTAGVRLHGTGHRVANNYFEGLGQFSISLPTGQSRYVATGWEPTVDAVVAHNTVAHPLGPAIVLGDERGGARDTPPAGLFAGNLVTGSRGPLVRELYVGKVAWLGNLMFASPPGSVGLAAREGILFADPRLERSPSGLWRPMAGSPALGAGPAGPVGGETDVDGQPRAAPSDIGADQRSDAPVTRRPLTPGDVGPAWRPR